MSAATDVCGSGSWRVSTFLAHLEWHALDDTQDQAGEAVFVAGRAGGGGGGELRRFSRIQLPRSTGEVRLEYDDTVSTLACVRMPPRCVPVRSTLRNSWPLTPGMP